MSTTQKSTDFLNPTGLVTQYPTLSMSVFRDATASFVSDHTFKVLSNLEKTFGTTPFPKEQWNSWENITSEKPEKIAAQKVEKPKKVPDPNDPKKKIVLKDQLELVDQRLKNPVSFNASAKQSLTFLITTFVHECYMAKGQITASDADSIRNAIVDHASANCDYVVSDLLFTICDKIGDDVMSAHFNTTHGKFKSSFEDRLNKIITDNEALRNVVLVTVLKFLKAYTLYVGSNTWFEVKAPKASSDSKTEDGETKTDEGDVSDAHETEGTSKTLGTKDFRQFLMDRDLTLMAPNARLDPSFYTAMTEYYAAVAAYDKQRSEDAAAAKAAKKAAEAAKKSETANSAAAATAEVPPPAADGSTEAPAPAPTATTGRRTATAAAAAVAVAAATEPAAATAPAPAPAAEQLGRRRRGVAGAN